MIEETVAGGGEDQHLGGLVTRTVTGHFAFARGWCVGAESVTRTSDGRGALVATPAVNGCFAA